MTTSFMWTISALLLTLSMSACQDVTEEPDSLRILVEQQANLIDQLQGKVAALENQMGQQDHEIAFNTRLSSQAAVTVARNDTVIFHIVDLNEGNGYDNTTGIFTAPVSGVYQFHTKIGHIPPGSLHVHIVKEGDHIAEAQSSGSDSDRSSTTVVVHLDQGQRLWVIRSKGTATQLAGFFETAFSGFLIHADD